MTQSELDAILPVLNEVQRQPSTELSVKVRCPRNGAKGYIVNFYRGSTHIAWAHVSSGSIVDLGKVIYQFVKHRSLPSERMIQLKEL